MGLVSAKSERLTEKEAQIVRDSWVVLMKNPEENAKIILDTFFGNHENYLPFFKKFKGIPKEELNQHPTYIKHGLAIVNALNSVIVNLDDDSKVKDSLQALGRQHGRYSITEGMFLDLKAAFLEILSGTFNLPEEGLVAWSKTFDIALNYINEGLKSTNS